MHRQYRSRPPSPPRRRSCRGYRRPRRARAAGRHRAFPRLRLHRDRGAHGVDEDHPRGIRRHRAAWLRAAAGRPPGGGPPPPLWKRRSGGSGPRGAKGSSGIRGRDTSLGSGRAGGQRQPIARRESRPGPGRAGPAASSTSRWPSEEPPRPAALWLPGSGRAGRAHGHAGRLPQPALEGLRRAAPLQGVFELVLGRVDRFSGSRPSRSM